MQETIRFLRHIWDDTGWRTAIIASFLTFLLETFMVVGDAPVGTSLMWTAMLVSLILISRGLTLRPLRGQLSDVENISLLLGIAGLGHCPGDLHLHQRRSDLHRSADLLAVLARLRLDPKSARGSSRRISSDRSTSGCLVLMFLYFWMTVGTWTAEAVFPEPPFTWSVAA